MIKKPLSFFISVLLILQCILLTGCSSGGMQIFDGNGELITSLIATDIDNLKLDDNEIKPYIEIVFNEAAELLAEVKNCDISESQKMLVNNEYSVYTYFDSNVYGSIKKAYHSDGYENLDFGCAVTNNTGQLLAIFSGGDSNKNFATAKTPPYSSIKPLSVYAPAIDSGIANWSKTYIDSPVKAVAGENGMLTEWPTNANGKYANKGITVHTAIQQSLNTIAVKCLLDYGVTRSLNFLKENFDFPLTPEENIISQYGEDEVLGNLGMGYLREGVSPVNMAGYYQIFANSGKYFEPTAIYEIKDNNGKTVYKRNVSINQVINESTANIMNLLLQEVITPAGTGKTAAIEGITVGGKTGTGEEGNWFVGFIPEYTCAIWHGTQLEKNNATKIFSLIINGIENKKLTSFAVSSEIQTAVYCCESGNLAGKDCPDTATGYFEKGLFPEFCDSH